MFGFASDVGANIEVAFKLVVIVGMVVTELAIATRANESISVIVGLCMFVVVIVCN